MDYLQNVFCIIGLVIFHDRQIYNYCFSFDAIFFICFHNYMCHIFNEQSSMVFYENCGLQNLYDIVRYCQVNSHDPQ
jgi:hypothetical protein